MKSILSLACALALASTPAVAAPNVTGKWPGTIEFANPDGGSRSEPALLILKQEGETVTGSGGPSESEQHPIQNGKLQGDRLTFEIVPGSGRTMRFDLKVTDDKIEGDVQGESRDGGKRTARLSLKRVAEKSPAPAAAQVPTSHDVTGRWSGSIGSRNDDVLVILERQGQVLTGTLGPNETRRVPIRGGKLEGDRLTFEVDWSGRTNRFDLKVAGDKIEGEIQSESRTGEKRIERLSLTRVADK